MTITDEELLNSWRIITIDGDITINNYYKINDKLNSLDNSSKLNLALDISKVKVLDSSGISLFVYLHKDYKKRDLLFSVFGATPLISEVLRRVHLHKHLSIFDNRDSFLNSIDNKEATNV